MLVEACLLGLQYLFISCFAPRLGKPSDHSRSVFQTERAKRTIHRYEVIGQRKAVGRGLVVALVGRGMLVGFAETCLQVASLLGLESRATIVARFSKPSERSARFTGAKILANERLLVGAWWLRLLVGAC